MMQHARITTLLVGLTSVAWLASLALGQFYDVNAFGGFVPARVSGEMTIIGALPVWATPLSATFLLTPIGDSGWIALAWCALISLGGYVWALRSYEKVRATPAA